jgi:hypothetical protein
MAAIETWVAFSAVQLAIPQPFFDRAARMVIVVLNVFARHSLIVSFS